MTSTMKHGDIARYLPADHFGAILDAAPISMGLSGASVYSVVTERGDFVLRVSPPNQLDGWRRQLAMQRLASAHSIAPELVWVDEAHSATVSTRIGGSGFTAALSDPGTRMVAIGDVVDLIARLHACPPDGLEPADPSAFARSLWQMQSDYSGLPRWASSLGDHLPELEAIVARDGRLVPSHNDLNPANILWDGARSWLVDWEASGLTHPYYDLAVLSLFLQIPEAGALGLLAKQERAAIGEEQAATFRALHRTALILYGLIFLGLVPASEIAPPERVEDAPTLAQCYAMLSTGELDVRSDAWQRAFGLALLRLAVT
jgi:aminoglycoside phosphotransferase (APT) family kinase protein